MWTHSPTRPHPSSASSVNGINKPSLYILTNVHEWIYTLLFTEPTLIESLNIKNDFMAVVFFLINIDSLTAFLFEWRLQVTLKRKYTSQQQYLKKENDSAETVREAFYMRWIFEHHFERSMYSKENFNANLQILSYFILSLPSRQLHALTNVSGMLPRQT